MGYEVGNVISKTVANIVTPKLLDPSENNPFYDETVFKKIDELNKKYKDIRTRKDKGEPVQDAADVQKQLEKAIKEYEAMVEDFANKKIECLTEEVVPVKKMDIEFICSTNSAHKTIKDALAAAFGDQITCEHVGCSDIEKALDEAEHGTRVGVGLEDIDGEIER